MYLFVWYDCFDLIQGVSVLDRPITEGEGSNIVSPINFNIRLLSDTPRQVTPPSLDPLRGESPSTQLRARFERAVKRHKIPPISLLVHESYVFLTN